jgi:Carbohydrate esterase, sialic acid-specific acetylesterase/Concanavalin A-like lectin/glucanases superfamily
MDVFIIAGQSNAVGLGFPKDPQLDFSSNSIWQYCNSGPYVNSIVPASENLWHFERVDNAVGFGMQFANHYLAHYQKPVLLIPCAAGGSGFTNNRWNPGDDLFEKTVLAANAVLNNKEHKLKGILWHQGETDNGLALNYHVPFITMANAMRQRLIGGKDCPIIVGTLVPAYIAELLEFNRQLQTSLQLLSEKLSYCACVSAVGLLPNSDTDKLHFNAKSQRSLGKRYFQAYQRLAGNPSPLFYFPFNGLYNDFTFTHNLTRTDGSFVADNERGKCLQLTPGENGQWLQTDCGMPIGDYTIMCWVKCLGQGIYYLLSTNARPYNLLAISTFNMLGDEGRFKLKTFYENENFAPTEFSSNQVFPVDKWVHIAATYNKRLGRYRHYQNGQITAEMIYGGTLHYYDNSPIKIGTTAGLNWDSLNGRLQDFSLWDIELTPEQVASFYLQ